MSNKKELSDLSDAFSKSVKRSISDQVDSNDFGIGFETNDIQMTTKDGKVHVTAHIDQKNFDKIIYTNAAYIIEFLKKYGV